MYEVYLILKKLLLKILHKNKRFSHYPRMAHSKGEYFTKFTGTSSLNLF